MAKVQSVWGIDVGQVALKAIKVRRGEGTLEVEAFDVIEHPRVLSEPDVDAKTLIHNALEKFLERNDVGGTPVCVSVPGQSSFTRFVKLPPVEPKKVPDIVRFEAEQQIPFPIADVIWRWQTFSDPQTPDIEVGIFAMKRSDVGRMLQNFSAVNMPISLVQMAPLSLYNVMQHDGLAAEQGATLMADVGADKTDLIVSDGPRIWTRTIQIGGNNFTEALVKAFKLSFSKAEKLKRTASTSKYARQIFQAMRPVFSDLVQEVQRSIGYYTSLHRESRFTKMVGLGNGFRLPGLQKFLEQNLNMPVVRIDNYTHLQPSSSTNAAAFAENVLSLGVAYGLAIQGLGLAQVQTNLLPDDISRQRIWSSKRPWFAGAAASLILVPAMWLYSEFSDKSKLATDTDLRQAQRIAKEFQDLRNEYNMYGSMGSEDRQKIEGVFKQYEYRDFWPSLLDMISRSIQQGFRDARHQQWLTEYATAVTEENRQAVLARIKAVPRSQRQMIFLESLTSVYTGDVMGYLESTGGASSVTPSGDAPAEAQRGFVIRITGRTPLPQNVADPFLWAILRRSTALSENYPMFEVVDAKVVEYPAAGERSTRAGAAAGVGAGVGGGAQMGGSPFGGDPFGGNPFGGNPFGGVAKPARQAVEEAPKAAVPDPLFPDAVEEDMAKDTRFVIRLAVSVKKPAEPVESPSGF